MIRLRFPRVSRRARRHLGRDDHRQRSGGGDRFAGRRRAGRHRDLRDPLPRGRRRSRGLPRTDEHGGIVDRSHGLDVHRRCGRNTPGRLDRGPGRALRRLARRHPLHRSLRVRPRRHLHRQALERRRDGDDHRFGRGRGRLRHLRRRRPVAGCARRQRPVPRTPGTPLGQLPARELGTVVGDGWYAEGGELDRRHRAGTEGDRTHRHTAAPGSEPGRGRVRSAAHRLDRDAGLQGHVRNRCVGPVRRRRRQSRRCRRRRLRRGDPGSGSRAVDPLPDRRPVRRRRVLGTGGRRHHPLPGRGRDQPGGLVEPPGHRVVHDRRCLQRHPGQPSLRRLPGRGRRRLQRRGVRQRSDERPRSVVALVGQGQLEGRDGLRPRLRRAALRRVPARRMGAATRSGATGRAGLVDLRFRRHPFPRHHCGSLPAQRRLLERRSVHGARGRFLARRPGCRQVGHLQGRRRGSSESQRRRRRWLPRHGSTRSPPRTTTSRMCGA